MEVLVELAAGRVDGRRRPEHAQPERPREPVELLLGLRVVHDAAEPALGCRDEQRADGRIDEVVGDVEEALTRCGVAEAAIELGGNGCH